MTRSKLALALALSTALTSYSVSANAEGFEAGSILVRARVLDIMPQTSNSSMLTNNGQSLATRVGTPGDSITVESAVIPEIDLSYFFTENIAVEAIAGTSRHKVKTNNSTAPDLGNTWLLPPTITAQWHFSPKGNIKPYLGVGINYTFLYDTLGSSAAGANSLSFSNSVGAAAQAGVDVNVYGNWYANLDLKYLWLSTDATFGGSGAALPVKSHVNLDPFIVGFGVGYRF